MPDIESEYEYYVFPEEINVEELEPEEADQYRIEAPSPVAAESQQEPCYPAERTRKKCRCGNPPVTRWAEGTVYRTASGRRCYARYQSCHVVCRG